MRSRLRERPSQALLLMEDNLDLQLLPAGLDSGKANFSIPLHGMAVAGVDECSWLPHRNVERRSLGQLAKIEIASMWSWRHPIGHARAQRREIAVRRRHAQGALERLQRDG